MRLADTSTDGYYEGTITATAGTVTAYANVEGEVIAPAVPPVVLYGDVNCDGHLTISDVTVLINYLLGGNPDPFDSIAANVNQDANISISDVTTLINMLLNGRPAQMMWNALPNNGGIQVVNPILLSRGTYIVSSDTRSRKVIVK